MKVFDFHVLRLLDSKIYQCNYGFGVATQALKSHNLFLKNTGENISFEIKN